MTTTRFSEKRPHFLIQRLKSQVTLLTRRMRTLNRRIHLDFSGISWSSPKSQWGISFQQLKENIWRLHFSASQEVSADTTQPLKVGQKEGFYDSPFSGGPWLLVWGKVEGWVCISRFCQWSSFGFHQWMEAMKRQNKIVQLMFSKLNEHFNSHNATMGSIYVHLLLLSACHTWELPDSTSPLRGYVRSSLGSLEPWGMRGDGQDNTPDALHCVKEVENVTECADVYKTGIWIVRPTCIR